MRKGENRADMFDAETLHLIAGLHDALNKFDPDARAFVGKAYELAMKAHAGQKRDGGEAYINHPLRVAIALVEKFGVKDHDFVAAALLHDALEDTAVTYDEVAVLVNTRVAAIVKTVTKRSLKEGETKEAYLDEYFFGIKNGHPACKMLKVADRLDNIADMMAMDDKARLERYIAETVDYVVPIAADLGENVRVLVLDAVGKAIVVAAKKK